MPDDIDLDLLRQVQSPDDLTVDTAPYFAPGEPIVVNEYVTEAELDDAPDEVGSDA